MTSDVVYYGLNTPLDGNKFLTNPRTLVCYVCGRQYGLNSYGIHLRQCKELWVAREGLKEKSERKPLPEDPTGGLDPKSLVDVSPTELAEINKAANETYNTVSLSVCQHCGRSFLNDKLLIHNKSCTASNPGRSVNKSMEARAIQDSLTIPERKFNMPRASPGPAKLTPTSKYDVYGENGGNSRRSSYDGRPPAMTPPSYAMRSLSGTGGSRISSEGRPKSVTSAKYESNSVDGGQTGRRKSITTLHGSSSCKLTYDGRPSSITPPKYGLRSVAGSAVSGSSTRPKSITPRRDAASVDGDSSRLSYNGRPKSFKYETNSVDGDSHRGTEVRRKSITPRRDGSDDSNSKYGPDGRRKSITASSVDGDSHSKYGPDGRRKSFTASLDGESNSKYGPDGRRKSITASSVDGENERYGPDGRRKSITASSVDGENERYGPDGRRKSITMHKYESTLALGSGSRVGPDGRPNSSLYEADAADGEERYGPDGRRKSITMHKYESTLALANARPKSNKYENGPGDSDERFGPDGRRKSITMHKYESTLALANGSTVQRIGSDGRAKFENGAVDSDTTAPYSSEGRRKSITASSGDGESERYHPDGRRKSITTQKYESTLATGNGGNGNGGSSYQRLTLDGKPKSTSKHENGSESGNNSRRGSFTGSVNERRRVSIIGTPSATHTEEKSGYQDVIPEPQEAEIGAEDRVAEMESRVATMAETICEMKSRIVDLKAQKDLEEAKPKKKEIRKTQHEACCNIC
jgi:hypothetical protein